ncbi:MAG TPA: type II secretion system F family protein, partial [Vicinamibacterales bacterium]|nr:type II secretion system F family protein [Vicinamibacterales bacterium]
MVSTLAPYAIVLGVIGTIGLAVVAMWERVERYLETFAGSFGVDVERADLGMSPQRIGAVLAIATVVLWLAVVIAWHPDIVSAILCLPVAFGITAFGFSTWVKRKVAQRIKAFNDQLELVLRLISSGLRVGLSLRQALVLVIEESPEPSRAEFSRVVARTNIGVSLDIALDDLARRVPSEELQMFVDAIDVQTKTGGNLAKILDHLATTIKARRHIQRKVRSLTGEAKMSGWVIGILPVGVGAFIMLSQPEMRDALLTTPFGHASLLAFF